MPSLWVFASSFVVFLAVTVALLPSAYIAPIRRILRQTFNMQEIPAASDGKGPFIMPQFIMLGDSITQYAWQPGGTGSVLADRYQRKLDLVNRGYSGYNTEWIIPVAKSIFARSADISVTHPVPKLLTIWLGANDAVLPHRPQHVPLNRFRENIHTIVSLLRSPSSPFYSPQTNIILITCPPVDLALRAANCAERFSDWKPENMDRTTERTKLFAETVKQVGMEAGLEVVDAWTAITEAEGGLGKYLIDGLHLTADGYAIVTGELWKIIETKFSHLVPDNLPHHFPWWGDIDPADPSKSFPHES